ncbi:MAG: hypothetical protein OSB02_02045 [Rhodospirillaceae bacterium]|jgi:hypothetical protein|nr:hypothetical protein [Rhodospirillaceae bacterium]
MTYTLTRIIGGISLILLLTAYVEPEKTRSLDIRIVDRENFTYTDRYKNGFSFKVRFINKTDAALAKPEAFIMDHEQLLFSISSELCQWEHQFQHVTFGKPKNPASLAKTSNSKTTPILLES